MRRDVTSKVEFGLTPGCWTDILVLGRNSQFSLLPRTATARVRVRFRVRVGWIFNVGIWDKPDWWTDMLDLGLGLVLGLRLWLGIAVAGFGVFMASRNQARSQDCKFGGSFNVWGADIF